MRKIIRLGDPTSHGGRVISVQATHYRVAGIAVACVGDICSCPIPGHGPCVIVSGSARHHINGIRVAFEDDLTSCGARLIPTFHDYRTADGVSEERHDDVPSGTEGADAEAKPRDA